MELFEMTRHAICAATAAAVLSFSMPAAAQTTQIPTRGWGPNPELPAPDGGYLPTVKVAPAKGWAEGGKPAAQADLAVAAIATDLSHPRWMHVLPNGDILVAETAAPPKGSGTFSVKGLFMKYFMGKAGAEVKSANRITLLRPSADGATTEKHVFLDNLNSPFGMALAGGTLYVANADALVKFPYQEGQTKIDAAPATVAALPGGPRNHHWTKGLVASKDGSKLYVSVGSNSNIGENGMDEEANRAAILEIDAASGAFRVFASGLRNPVGMALEPTSGELFTVVNERDELGNDLVPDYLTSVKDGGFYGWPYSYFGQIVDARVTPPRPDLVEKAIKPDYGLGAHTASLGLAFGPASKLPERFANGAFIGQHGSWNREPPSGYKVVFVPYSNGKPNGEALDVLTGFLDGDGNALGRPVGVEVAKDGSLLVADDVGNAIWRVTGSGSTSEATPR